MKLNEVCVDKIYNLILPFYYLGFLSIFSN